MSRYSGLRRSRLTTLVAGASLMLTLVAAPSAVVAQDTPEEAVAGVFTAMEEWRFDEIVDSFCVEQASAASALDFGGQISQFLVGVSPEQLQAALQFGVEGLDVQVLEQDEVSAHVRIVATLAISVDPEAARELVLQLFASLGQEDPPDALIDQSVDQLATQLAGEATEIDEEADLVVEDGVWKICSPVGPAAAGGTADDGSADATDDASSGSTDEAATDDGAEDDADGE